MSFLFPHILWGLIAVAVPVIIHLFNFRKFRKVYFTNVRFLEELKQQTRKQSKLRHLLVMFSRMLAIAALVIAFAQPFIKHENSASRPEAVNHVSVYLDNSFSMEALSPSGPLLESAKVKAKEIAAAYRSTDLFRLTTNDFEGRHQRWVNQEEFLQMIDEVVITPDVRTISEILSRQNESYFESPGQARISYLLSDFQLGITDFENIPADSLMSVRLVPLEAVRTENLFIDSCWFVSPVHQLNQGVKLVVRIVNDSEVNYEKVPLTLTVNGKQKALASFDVRAGSLIDVELPFTNYDEGIQSGVAEITDYPVIFDDRMFIAYHVAGSIPVLAINGGEESPYLNSLYGADSVFSFSNNLVTNIDYNRLQDYELIILNEIEEISSGLGQELTSYLDNGGTILVIPSGKINIESYQQFLSAAGLNYYSTLTRESTRVSGLDQENPVFSEVFEKSADNSKVPDNTDLPSVTEYYPISTQSQSSQIVIMSMLNGKPFLSRESAGSGQVFLLAVPLGESFSNFARHALFVPALFRIALLSAATDPLYYTIGKDNRIELSNSYISGDQVLKITAADEDIEFIPGTQNLNRKMNLFLFNQVRKAGYYELQKNDEVIKGLGFNYNRKESVMKFAGKPELEELVRRFSLPNFVVFADKGKPLSDIIKDINQGTTLWKLFIILALIFLAIEVVLLRFWRSEK
jgi:hypothetical protein